MKNLTFTFVLLPLFALAQPHFDLTLKDSVSLNADTFWGADNFGNFYFSKGETLYKKTATQSYTYYALSLGQVASIDLLNPLKITLFYKDFNTVVVLDNQLAEIERINLNTRKTFRVASHITTGFERNLWLFNTDLQQLELYNYAQDNTQASTQPINKKVLAQVSNYNYCWLLTTNSLLQYNIYGSPTDEYPLTDASSLKRFRDTVVFRRGNDLFYYSNRFRDVFMLPKISHSFEDFFITESTLYLYHNNQVYIYLLKFQN
ncbi:MAG: hypothetical protein RQ735_04620 [Flavobacteriaceae bacterium]|nr:hypothetical protein [Flavobacteriaceae bacterium]